MVGKWRELCLGVFGAGVLLLARSYRLCLGCRFGCRLQALVASMVNTMLRQCMLRHGIHMVHLVLKAVGSVLHSSWKRMASRHRLRRVPGKYMAVGNVQFGPRVASTTLITELV